MNDRQQLITELTDEIRGTIESLASYLEDDIAGELAAAIAMDVVSAFDVKERGAEPSEPDEYQHSETGDELDD